MKHVMFRGFFLALVAFAVMLASDAVFAQVYKVVDKDGNVSYTDRPPPDGSAPIKLAPISIIEAPTYEQPAKADAQAADGAEGKEVSLRDLRKQYKNFAIVAPQQEESVWHPESAMSVAWNAGYQLQEGMQVTIYIDGKQHSKGSQSIVAVADLDRGEHKIEAKLTDARNRTIATAEPVTFFIRPIRPLTVAGNSPTALQLT